jgi:putative ABC transport system permease protein
MFASYAVIFFRHFWKNRFSLTLSFIGLSLAFAFAYVVGVTVKDTLTSDRWLASSNNLYRVIQHGYDGMWSDTIYGPYGPLINSNIEDVETAVRLINIQIKGTIGTGQEQFGVSGTFVDGDFAKAFPLPVIAGDIYTTLIKPRGVVLSKTNAERFFGEESPIGKTISVDLYGTLYDYEVGAVLDDMPGVTHLAFDMIMPFDLNDVRDERLIREVIGFGSSGSINTYVLLKDSVDAETFRSYFWDQFKAFIPEPDRADERRLDIESVKGLQFWSKPADGTLRPPVDRQALLGVTLTVLLVLIAAVSNHMNLTVAATLRRGREVAIRRILGASRTQVIFQLFIETLIFTVIAAFVSLDVALIIVEFVGGYVGQELNLNVGNRWFEVSILMTIAVFSALLIALYPVFWVGRTQARNMLTATQGSITGGGKTIRMVLVSVQVALGMGLVFATYMIDQQVQHVTNVDKGFNYQNKLHVNAAVGEAWMEKRVAFARELSVLDGVSNYSFANIIPFINDAWRFGFPNPRTGEHMEYEGFFVSPDFFKQYGLYPLAGRLLSVDYGSDELAVSDLARIANAAGEGKPVIERSVVISEATVKRHGFASNEAAIGEVFRSHVDTIDSGTPNEIEFEYRAIIVGVVPDISFKAGKIQSFPAFYEVDDLKDGVGYDYLTLDIDDDQFARLLPQIEGIWQRFFPDDIFTHSRAIDNLEGAYSEETSMLELFALAGGLSLLITITGIFSLARFLMMQRTREVALRKVLGASRHSIVQLMIKEFSKPVIVGLLVGIPSAIYMLTRWLETYQTRLEFGIGDAFIFACVSFGFCLVLVLSETARAVRIRPAQVLYHE